MAVIPNPYQESHTLSKDVSKLREQYGIEQGDRVFGIVGRIVRWKGHIEFLNAAFIVLQEVPDAKALIIKKGCTLVVTDTLFMRPGARIEVRNGAVLEIDGGAIKGLCGWEGIDVIESRKKGARPVKSSGKVIRRNGGSISDAEYGIRNVSAKDRNMGRGQGD